MFEDIKGMSWSKRVRDLKFWGVIGLGFAITFVIFLVISMIGYYFIVLPSLDNAIDFFGIWATEILTSTTNITTWITENIAFIIAFILGFIGVLILMGIIQLNPRKKLRKYAIPIALLGVLTVTAFGFGVYGVVSGHINNNDPVPSLTTYYYAQITIDGQIDNGVNLFFTGWAGSVKINSYAITRGSTLTEPAKAWEYISQNFDFGDGGYTQAHIKVIVTIWYSNGDSWKADPLFENYFDSGTNWDFTVRVYGTNPTTEITKCNIEIWQTGIFEYGWELKFNQTQIF